MSHRAFFSTLSFALHGAMLASLCVLLTATNLSAAEPTAPARFVDLSLLVAPDMPGSWPAAGFAPFHIDHYLRIGPLSAYNSDILTLDGNTGTQLDVPPHSIPLPDSNLPNAGPFGRMFTDKVPAWQFAGEACVVDCRDLLDSKVNGHSALVKRDRIIAWEKQHRPLGPGDVVLLRSDYSDQFYRPLPAGRRFLLAPVDGTASAWPDPDPDCMDYFVSRKVMALGTDSASMGPLPTLAEPTHLAGLKHGLIWAESATALGQVPETGAFYCLLAPRHADGLYSEARAISIVGNPLAGRLIESARAHRVRDLSVVLSNDLPVTWPGRGAGNHRHPYLKIALFFAPTLGTYHTTHMLDAHAGTHLVPPSFALPRAGFDHRDYAPEVQTWLAEYEKTYGPRGTSDVTTEQVELAQTAGQARVIDVQHRIGTTDRKQWPQSPEITVADIQQYETKTSPLQAGDIVIFSSGHSDRYFKPLPEGLACLAEPLAGKREGWPAPGPAAIGYLASKGIRCVGTDAPALGSVDPKQALFTYWAMGTKGIVGIEYLTDVATLPTGAYFLFAPVKVRGCHGGPGRALAFY